LFSSRASVGEIFERSAGELGRDDALWLCSCPRCSAAIVSVGTVESRHFEAGCGFQDDFKAGAFCRHSQRLLEGACMVVLVENFCILAFLINMLVRRNKNCAVAVYL